MMMKQDTGAGAVKHTILFLEKRPFCISLGNPG